MPLPGLLQALAPHSTRQRSVRVLKGREEGWERARTRDNPGDECLHIRRARLGDIEQPRDGDGAGQRAEGTAVRPREHHQLVHRVGARELVRVRRVEQVGDSKLHSQKPR